ncbi:MAG: hypothetical protein IKC22_06330 [Bacilli bacterium]|nr:hypothetical protein [Bacilli bacterium]
MKFQKVCFLMVVVLLLIGCTPIKNPNKDQTPHEHEYIEGKCACGAIDPNEVVHVHKYVDGVCSCGKIKPIIPDQEDKQEDIYKDVVINISINQDTYYENDNIIVDIDVNMKELINHIDLKVTDGTCEYEIVKNVIIPKTVGRLKVIAEFKNIKSNELIINVEESIYVTNYYDNMTRDDFYDNFFEAINYQDVILRNKKGFMSGDINTPDEEPLLASYQPKNSGKYLRNINTYYSSDLSTYYITDAYGEIVDMVFKEAGYISLDEVAAHLLAFGMIPANYNASKKASPSSSIWKEYLRVNNTKFSGSTSKYPYEPALPNISGCGGSLQYYEIDFGTTGTTCDSSYNITIYNNGSKITRGAARLVYTSYDINNNKTLDANERYVFYTYNHYNDFQEYLNYQGGWGEMFGNITGGGSLSSKTNYNPTPYVETIKDDFSRPLELEVIFPNMMVYKKDDE